MTTSIILATTIGLLIFLTGFLIWLKVTSSDTPKHKSVQTIDADQLFERDVARPQEHPKAFLGIMSIWVMSMIVGLWFAVANWTTKQVIFDDYTIMLGQSILVLEFLWIISSIKVIRVDQVGAIMLYGWTMIRVGRGPKIVVFGILQLIRFNASVIQNQHPAEPELIQKTADEVPLEVVTIIEKDGTETQKTKVRPIRITTAGPKTELEESDILNVQMTVEFTFWVRWLIVDPVEYQINTGGDEDRAVRQMRDSGESLLNTAVTKLTPSELVSHFSQLQGALTKAITEAVALWGIRIVGVGLTAPDLNHKVAQAMRDIPIAKAERVTIRIAAEAEAFRLAQEGRGRAKAREEELAGEGRGYKRAGELIGVEPETVLAAQVARETVGEADLILGVEGITQVLGLGKKLLEVKKSDSETPTPKTGE